MKVFESFAELCSIFARCHYGRCRYEPRGPQAGHPLQGPALILEKVSAKNFKFFLGSRNGY